LSFLTLAAILADCQSGGWAVPAFDAINQETILAVLEGAVAERAPVILMLHPVQTAMKYWPGLVALIQVEARSAQVPVCLHMDHATSVDQVRMALDLGFSGVMIDGSRLPLEQNMALCRQVALEAHARGASVEAELGHVGRGGARSRTGEDDCQLTRVEEAKEFVAETGIDALAVSIGTVHGLYLTEPRLDFDRLARLRELVPVPLVLHGGSGTPDADIRRAIAGGICKINFWTEVALAFVAVLKKELSAPTRERRLNEMLPLARDNARDVVQQKIRLLGASGRSVGYLPS
jgi:fructose-bisphosphate aldolase class II